MKNEGLVENHKKWKESGERGWKIEFSFSYNYNRGKKSGGSKKYRRAFKQESEWSTEGEEGIGKKGEVLHDQKGEKYFKKRGMGWIRGRDSRKSEAQRENKKKGRVGLKSRFKMSE